MLDLKIGIITSMGKLLEEGAGELKQLGLSAFQLNEWDPRRYTQQNAQSVQKIADDGFFISSLWAGWGTPAAWNFIDGPATLGIVPAAYRANRIEYLKAGADFAKELGITDVTTHVGFIPENPSTTEYREVVAAVREVADYCKRLGLYFNFETGQETPTTLLRIIDDVATGNLGINLDPANLLLYGKANPCDAVDQFKGLIRGVHVKDGFYPTNGRELGKEARVGDGLVNFPRLIEKLHQYGYGGALIIEREISGPQQKVDILYAKELLEGILSKL